MTPELGDMELEKMKYADLQKLAKDAGVKANMKVDKLIKALQDHYNSSPSQNADLQEAKPGEVLSASEESADTDGKDSDREPTKAATSKRAKKRAAPKRKGRKAKPEQKSEEKTPKASTNDVNTPKVKSAVKTRTPRLIGVRNATPQRSTPKLVAHAKATPKRTPLQRGTPKMKHAALKSSTPRRRSLTSASKTPTRTPNNKITGTQQGNSTKKVLTARRSKSLTPGKITGSSKKTSSLVDLNASENVTGNPGNTQIPRFAAFVVKKKAVGIIANADKKPITPGNKDWSKIHQRNFDKMDSLDVYLEKKRKRVESVSDSVKRARLTMETVKESCNKLQNHKTPDFKSAAKTSFVRKRSIGGSAPFQSPIGQNGTRNSPFKSVSSSQMNMMRDTPQLSNGKVGDSIAKSIMKAIEGKNRKDLTSASAEMLTTGQDTMTSSKKATAARKSIRSGAAAGGRKSIGTPFKFNMNGSICTNFGDLNQTIGDAQSAKKATFDLKASLSKPVSWKMHTGALKTFSGKPKPGTAANPNVKVPKLKTREGRRSEMVGNRNNQKTRQHMQRRGIDV